MIKKKTKQVRINLGMLFQAPKQTLTPRNSFFVHLVIGTGEKGLALLITTIMVKGLL